MVPEALEIVDHYMQEKEIMPDYDPRKEVVAKE